MAVIPLFPDAPRPVRSMERAGWRSRPVPASARALLEQADRGLTAVESLTEPADRFVAAHLAALRAAAAAVAVLAHPTRRRSKAQSVWALLATLAPNLREWVAFFAAGSGTRAAVEAGITRLVDQVTADRQVTAAREFVALVRTEIGVGGETE